MGDRLAAGLRHLKDKHEIIGDLRGFGLLQGVELVKDRETRTPDVASGRAITQRCMELGLSMNIVVNRRNGGDMADRPAPDRQSAGDRSRYCDYR